MDMVIGMGSGVIPTLSCSSQLHYATQFNEIEQKFSNFCSHSEATQILLWDMKEGLSKMQEEIDMLMARVGRLENLSKEGLSKMQEEADTLMALVRRLENLSNIIYFFSLSHTHTLIVRMDMIMDTHTHTHTQTLTNC
jgi:hypothetical protein